MPAHICCAREYIYGMDKYDGMNKPEIILTQNALGADSVSSKLCENLREENEADATGRLPKGGRIKSFFVRMTIAFVLLALVFLPRFIPYKGSENVTNVVKTVVMTDITGNKRVGEGKLADLIREIIENFYGEK